MSKIITLLTIGVLLSTPLKAQKQVADALDLNRIVVTASKIPQLARETTKSVTIISRTEIERFQGADLAQLLHQQSGIVVNGAGSNPTAAKGVYLQGATGQYTLILIDGVPVNDPSGSGGAYDPRLFPLGNIEQIEIVKGSQSTLYGTDAIAGVINIITKKESLETVNLSAGLSYGTYNSFNSDIALRGSLNEMLGYSVSYTHASSDGTSEAEEPEGATGFDDDGFSQDAISTRLIVNPLEGLSIQPFLNYSFYDGEYDAAAFTDAPDNTFELKSFVPGVQFGYSLDRVRVNGSYQYTRTQREFISGFDPFNTEGRFHDVDVYSSGTISDQFSVLGGFNYQNNQLPASTNGVEESADIISPYLTFYANNINGFSAEIGYRLNSHTEYGNNSTFSFSPSFQATEEIKILASVSSGFKAPTLTELFSPGNYGGNPDLDPQKSFSLEGGIETRALDNTVLVKVQGFRRSIDDVIVFQFASDFLSGSYFNLNEQNFWGIEIDAEAIVSDGISLSTGYQYLKGETINDDGNGNTSKTKSLIRRPEHRFNMQVSVQPIDDLTINALVDVVGERPDTDFSTGNEVTLDAYVLANLQVSYAILPNQLTIVGDLNNIFDTEYNETYGFATWGRNAKIGLRFKL
ncbi:MAG: TonB-dependent receptor [Balneola sp.]|nr:MAG: TonB-dependent receptor [Balneola sp.]